MEIRIAEKIRAFRRERGMTQEQLAEVLGVTVGAVSKWESAQTTPELGLIVEMAHFFETSVDVLLGYELSGGSMERAVETIRQMKQRKEYDGCVLQAEKALQKYPNSFEVVYYSARLFHVMGMERKNQKALRRAMELLERAKKLIAQNTDESINEIAIQIQMAEIYLSLEEPEQALQLLKRNNFRGVNSDLIGVILAANCHKPDEALTYLSDALVTCLGSLFRIVSGYVSAYEEKGRYKQAEQVILWLEEAVQGLKIPGKRSFLEKGEAVLFTACAMMAVKQKRMDAAEAYLRRAKELAEYFDASPESNLQNIRFHVEENEATVYDSFGQTAADGIMEVISQDEETKETLLSMLKQIEI